MPEEVWRGIVEERGLPRYSPTTITTVEAFEAELECIRQRGYAIDNSETGENVRCVAAPIYDYTGQVIAAASISGPADRMRPDRDPFLGEMVRNLPHHLRQPGLYHVPGRDDASTAARGCYELCWLIAGISLILPTWSAFLPP